MQHADLVDGKWTQLSLMGQLANIGCEVIRAISWGKRGNERYATLAFHRALELTDLTLDQPLGLPALQECARMREALVDYFFGKNMYGSSDHTWETYFTAFTYAAAKEREKSSLRQ